HEDRLAGRQLEAPDRGVERREEPVLGEDSGMRQRVEQGRLAGVRVADERDPHEARLDTGLALRAPSAVEVREVALETGDARAHAASVDLELGLPRAPRPDTAAEAREIGPLPSQPRQLVA